MTQMKAGQAVIEALRAASDLEMDGAGIALDPTVRGELRAVMNNYFAHLIGHRLRMSEYLGALAQPMNIGQ